VTGGWLDPRVDLRCSKQLKYKGSVSSYLPRLLYNHTKSLTIVRVCGCLDQRLTKQFTKSGLASSYLPAILSFIPKNLLFQFQIGSMYGTRRINFSYDHVLVGIH